MDEFRVVPETVRVLSLRRTAIAVIVFSIAMGYVESAVVVDLRWALGLPLWPTFPLTEATGPTQRLALIEIGREAATLVMLVGVGVIAGRRGWEWLAWTAVAFGVWDIAYYGWLWVFMGWPTSLFDWDLLFLIPVPWIGPVIAPVLVSAALIVFGLLGAARYRAGRDPQITRRHILAGVVGGALVLLELHGRRATDPQRRRPGLVSVAAVPRRPRGGGGRCRRCAPRPGSRSGSASRLVASPADQIAAGAAVTRLVPISPPADRTSSANAASVRSFVAISGSAAMIRDAPASR